MFNDRKDVDSILSALGEQLEQLAGEVIEILVCGGSALNVAGLIQRTTKDVDVLACINRTGTGDVLLIKADPLHPALIAAAKKVARDFNLPETWLNAGPASPICRRITKRARASRPRRVMLARGALTGSPFLADQREFRLKGCCSTLAYVSFYSSQ